MGRLRVDPGLVTHVRARLGRPQGIAEDARWLFAGLVLASVLLALPAPLLSSHGVAATLAIASAVVLLSTWTGVYLTGRYPLWCDVLLAVAITGFALAGPNPTVVFPVAFGGVWFGALYGPTWRSLLRCALYCAGIVMTLPLWHLTAGHTATPPPELVIGSAPAMVLTVLVGRHLAMGLEAREHSLRRDRALATLGSQILAETDAAAIRASTSTAASEICSATPGLRVIHAVRDGFALRVDLASGEFASAPNQLPRSAVTVSADTSGMLVDAAVLDAAAGTVLEWTCLRLDDDRGDDPDHDPDHGDGWTLVGAPQRLPASAILAVGSLIVMMTLALRNSHVHQELTMQARVDALTGLANRTAFAAALTDALARPSTFNPVHLLFLDLDDFKDVNDGLGHRAGDEVLAEIAVRLRTCTRSQDVCARIGGDEFAVILVDTPGPAVTEIAERMVRALAEPFRITGHTAQVGASIGLAASAAPGPRSGFARAWTPSVAELCHQADVAMYAAKANGKGQVQWFDTALLPGGDAASESLASPA